MIHNNIIIRSACMVQVLPRFLEVKSIASVLRRVDNAECVHQVVFIIAKHQRFSFLRRGFDWQNITGPYEALLATFW